MENELLFEKWEKKFPKSAFDFYVKIYQKRKKVILENNTTSSDSFKEATTSWLCLSKQERRQFTYKYNLCRENYKEKIGDYLKEAVPYMKRRLSSCQRNFPENVNVSNLKQSKDRHLDVDLNSAEEGVPHDEFSGLSSCQRNFPGSINVSNLTQSKERHLDVDLNSITEEGAPCVDEVNEQIGNLESSLAHNNSINSNHPKLFMSKPVPPTIRSGRELFEFTKGMTNINENVIWQSLHPSTKGRYRRAILSLKMQYINCYKAYLENMSPEELFNYYINKPNN